MSNDNLHPPQKKPTAAYSWAVVAMLWFICFFNYADRQAIFSVFKLLETEFEFSKSDLGLIGAAFTWTYALFAPMAGAVGDHYPRKVVILCGLYVWSLITGLTAVCSRVWHFVIVRAAEGVGETFYMPASMSLISDYHGQQTRSRAMSVHQSSVYAGTIGGGALAGWLGQEYGWQAPFVLLAGAGIVLGVVLATFIREPSRPVTARPPALNATDVIEERLSWEDLLVLLFRTPTSLALIFAFFGANFVAVIFLVWMPTFLNETFSMNLAWSGLTATFFVQAASIFGVLAGGLLADLWSRRLAGGRILVQALGALLGAPFIFLCGVTEQISIMILAMTFFGFFKGMYDSNIWASLMDVIPPSRRATVVGWMNMVGWLGGGLGAWLIGIAADNGITMGAAIGSTAIIYLLVSCILTLAAFLFAPRDKHRAGSI